MDQSDCDSNTQQISTIEKAIEIMPEFRTILLNNIGPVDANLLRVALGGKQLMSIKESMIYSNVFALLGLNLNWIQEVNELGYAVTLVGKDLLKLNDILYTPLPTETLPRLKFNFIVMCTGGSHSLDEVPPLVNNVNAALEGCLWQTTPGRWSSHITVIGPNFDAVLMFTSDREHWRSRWLTKELSPLIVELQTSNTTEKEFITFYVWVNFKILPEHRPRIRRAYTSEPYPMSTLLYAGKLRFRSTYRNDFFRRDDNGLGRELVIILLPPPDALLKCPPCAETSTPMLGCMRFIG
jgi:hypothetical protein